VSSRRRERAISDEGAERLGVLAHEMRGALSAAMLSFGSIKKGNVAAGGSTGAMLERSHLRLQTLIDRSLADARLDAGLIVLVRVPVSEVIEEVEIGAAILAEAGGLRLGVTTVDHTVTVDADRPILAAAIASLLHNAIKFTLPGSSVRLRASTTTDRVLIEVEDECGGLPTGAAESLLEPLVRKGRDRTGPGLGLSICEKAVKRMGGELSIRDIPGKGCVFKIDLQRQLPPPSVQAHDARRAKEAAQASRVRTKR
jgi:signal transduction histidine kinase